VFSGNINVGRLYLRVYPERRAGSNAFHHVQRTMNRHLTHIFVIGLHNLVDNLTAFEAKAMSDLIDRWWNRSILDVDITHLRQGPPMAVPTMKPLAAA
jgi:hypothetical protein